MRDAAQILMENANEVTRSTDLCVVPATMLFNPNEYRVRTNPLAVRYPHEDIGGKWQAEGVPYLVERYTTASWAYEFNESDSNKDEELMEESGLEDTTMMYEIHTPDPAPLRMAPESRSEEDPRELESGRRG